MGGPGSGRWYRSKSVPTTDESKRIDIRWFKKQGRLTPYRSGRLYWTIGGEESGDIRYNMYRDNMQLTYRIRTYFDDDWRDLDYRIRFDETPCNYGGTRKWFLCPHCGKRVAVLYLAGAQIYFLCRSCAGVKHSSNLEGPLDRLNRKSRKIQQRLDPEGLDDDFYHKPKGMHWRTFNRLVEQDTRLQDQINNALLARFGCWL